MTYLVLARKYRPRSFDTLIGQDHVVRALTHALDTQRLHHAWLFTGTRGVGKTTLSRILAKSLNCDTGITSKPCGVCRACTEIDAGRFTDYVELDAASNRGVDEMTQLLEQAVYAPSVGRFKVYMIDEVHMLTGHAFNAMLKTLEEPPPHVKFIIATTDPQKIPVTVLSRCLQFNLKQMPPDAIVGHLQQVLAEEQIERETPALRLIAQAASGSMRDALSLTDQAIAYSAGNLTEEAVRGMLGTIDQRHLVRLIDALTLGDANAVLDVADELSTRGLSYAGALGELAVLLSRVAVEQRVTGVTPVEDPLAEDIARLAGVMHGETVQLFYSVAVHSRGELALAPDEYAGFVMTCLRMLALLGEAGPPVARLQSSDAAALSGKVAASASAAAATPVSAHATPAESFTQAVPAVQAAPTAPVVPAMQATPAVQAEQAAPAARTAPVAHAEPTIQAEPAMEAAPADQAEPAEQAAPVDQAEPAAPAATAGPAEPAAQAVPAIEAESVAPAASAAPNPHDAPAIQTEAAAEPAMAAAPAAAISPIAPIAPLAPPRPATQPPHPARQPPTPEAPAPQPPRAANASAANAAASDAAAGEPPSWVDEAIPDDAEGDFSSEPTYDTAYAGADDDEDFETLGVPDAIAPQAIAAIAAPGRASAPKGAARSAASRRRNAPRLKDMTREAWPDLAARLPATGLAAEVARQSEWCDAQDDTVTLRVAVRTLADSNSRVRLQTLLCEHFGQTVRLEVIVGATGDSTAHAVAQSVRAARQTAAEQAVAADPFVQALLADFGGRVIPNSIRAVDPPAAA
jgi:DNA polymerase-3 subunit gamma/tau